MARFKRDIFPYSNHIKEIRLLSIRSCYYISIFYFLFSASCWAQETHYYFHHAYSYGSDGLFNPLSLIMNGGWDTDQDINRQPLAYPYWKVASINVWRSVTSSVSIINKYGWSRFIKKELLPINPSIDNTESISNLMLHTIGGGMEFRKITEWYYYHNVPIPHAFGLITCITYEFCNEVVENGPNYYPNIDCIPDILIFQPLGMVLFSFDGIAKFFSFTLNLNDWSEPAAFSFLPFAIRNAGQNFVMKLALNQNSSKSLFFHYGSFAILGLSIKTNKENSLSFGAGVTSTGTKQLPVYNGVPSNTVKVGSMAGVYFDRNNSLLASLVLSEKWISRIRLNIYPGLIYIFNLSPGFFMTVTGNNTIIAGVTINIFPAGFCFYSSP